MKIFQFTPNPLLKTNQMAGSEAAAAPAKAAADFASVLKQAADKSQTPSPRPDRAVFQENRRALQLPSQTELGLAGRLLTLLNSEIRSASPEALRNVHNLEGLIYVYGK